MCQGCDCKGLLTRILLISVSFILFIRADSRIGCWVYSEKDTIWIGEPIVLTFVLKNVSKEKVGIPYQPTDKIEDWIHGGFLAVILKDPKGTSHKYYPLYPLVVHNEYGWPPEYSIPLLPQDSVYFRYFLFWQNFSEFRRPREELTVDKLEEGEYSLQIALNLKTLPEKLKKERNVYDWECYGKYEADAKMYAKKPKGKELKNLNKLLKLSYPERERKDERREMSKQLLLDKSPFDYYLNFYYLWLSSHPYYY